MIVRAIRVEDDGWWHVGWVIAIFITTKCWKLPVRLSCLHEWVSVKLTAPIVQLTPSKENGMIKLEPLLPSGNAPASSESAESVIIDCGEARERTRGAPVGFSGEMGWPPYTRFLVS